MDLEAIRYVYLRRMVATILGALGLDVTRAIAGRLARGVFDLHTPGRHRAETRLREAMGPVTDDAAITTIVAAMYRHIGRFWTETLFAKRLLRDASWRRFVRVEDEAALRAMADAPRGCVLATAYYGNPVVGACAMGQIFRPVHVIVDKLAQPQLRAWQDELYSRRWVRPIDWRAAANVVPAVLRRGGAVMMICEHERRGGKAVPARFLGRTLDCYPTLGRLSQWFDVPVAVVTCRREGEDAFSFVLDLHTVIERQAACSSDSGLDSSRAPAGPSNDGVVRQVMATLEQAIMAHPEQYLWSTPTIATATVNSEYCNSPVTRKWHTRRENTRCCNPGTRTRPIPAGRGRHTAQSPRATQA
ncbi:MAG: hypothetical protein JXQ75_18100 [Phycisphaerae bacterium]|nr:hypothetical protein [Phycisphaerae bacterium]